MARRQLKRVPLDRGAPRSERLDISRETRTSMGDLSIRGAAQIAGVGLIAMAGLAILGTLGTQNVIVAEDAAATARNIAAGELLFRIGICAWLIVAILDVIVALALFVVLKPVNQSVSLLAGWFRIVYAAVFVAAISNFLLAL